MFEHVTASQYSRTLKEVLEAKDPRGLTGRAKQGSLLFVFIGGPEPERLTVRIGKSRVEVVDGAHSLEGEPVLLVRCRLEDWLAYSAEPSTERLGLIEFYGDMALLGAMSDLIQQKRSAISARFFSNPTTTSPKKNRSF